MRRTVLIAYQGAFRAPGDPEGIRSKQGFEEEVEVDIDECADEEAPVAFRFEEDGKTVEVRWRAGRHYRQAPCGMKLDAAVDAVNDGETAGLADGYDVFGYQPRCVTYDPGRHRDMDEDRRAAAFAGARAWASNLLSVDGMVSIACAEPHYVVEEWGEVRISTELAAFRPGAKLFRRDGLTLTDAGRFRSAADPPAGADPITVLLPEAVTMRPERDALYWAAHHLMDTLGWMPLRELDPAVVEALARTHGTLSDFARTGDDTALAGAFSGLVASVERPSRRIAGLGVLIPRYRLAIDHWNACAPVSLAKNIALPPTPARL